ncbi:MAG: DUF368 domain-containing protein [Candidatus Nanosalina sp.]
MSLKEWITVYLKGAAMGAADAVPGVSGGTIALITGIYQRLISSLSSPDLEKMSRGLEYVREGNIEGMIGLMREMDVPFLAVLGMGIVSSVFFVLNLVHLLLENYAISTYAFFFGLIAASAAVLYTEVDIKHRKSQLSAFAGFLTAFTVSGFGATSINHSPLVVFISGAIAVSAMILPGISGSLMLVILGQYKYMSGTVSNFTKAVVKFFNGKGKAELFETSVPVFIFIVGAVTGVLSLVKVVDYALRNYRKATMAFLVSLMAGALRAPLKQIGITLQEEGVEWVSVLPEILLAAVLGALVIFILNRKSTDLG